MTKAADPQRVLRVLRDALELDPEERQQLLDRECTNEPEVRAEVELLLRSEDDASGYFQRIQDAVGDAEPPAVAGPDRGSVGSEGDSELTGSDPSPESEQSLPERLGPYLLLETLGQGGMGSVFLAEQTEPVRRRVALKVIRLGLNSEEVVTRFEAERQVLALLDHPRIAHVFEAGSTKAGLPYFAMEYVRGLPITDYCDRERLNLSDRLKLFTQVCQGIAHAHERQIVHRDIKPSNVLVTESDDGPSVKIIDFGIAKVLDRQLLDRTRYTELGHIVGTPAYMSPEQARGTPDAIDRRTDVYALGVLLYELLAGELPLDKRMIERAAYDEVLRLVREYEAAPPSVRWNRLSAERSSQLARLRSRSAAVVGRDLRGDLDWIVMKALDKEPSRRYESAGDLAADVRRFLADEPVLARTPSVIYKVRKFVRKNRSVVAAVTTIVALLVAGLVVSIWLALIASDRLDKVLQLSDLKKLADQKRRAEDDLWPAIPARAGDMEVWLGEAGELVRRLALHKDSRNRLATQSADTFDVRTHWHLEQLDELIRGLEDFSDQDPSRGTIAAVRERLEFARSIYGRSVTEHEEKWREALEAIAGPSHPHYRGLRIEHQVGLVPLGPDPDSGLWEFAHLRTGEPARRGADGKLELTEESGLVFVLLPPDSFRMGAKLPPENSERLAPNEDPLSEGEDESPVHAVNLAAFFISKYEMTQGQWLGFTGDNPSRYPPRPKTKRNLLHPVENVDSSTAGRILHRLGLELPSESQWEYAARGGRSTVWWTGNDRSSLEGAENLADLSLEEVKGESWRDGFQLPAPVGSFQANPFGLHDSGGNVREWCRDFYSKEAYRSLRPAENDGLRSPSEPDQARVVRGSSWSKPADQARSADRQYSQTAASDLGLRPARALDGSGP